MKGQWLIETIKDKKALKPKIIIEEENNIFNKKIKKYFNSFFNKTIYIL